MEILFGIGIMFLLGFVCVIVAFIAITKDIVEETVDFIRFKRFKSGKSNVPPKNFCKYNWVS